MDSRPAKLDIYQTAIPMRRFEHAAADRDLAEAVVVRLELADGRVGWGETLPREYVTGETLVTVPRDIEAILWPAALAGEPAGKDLPATDGDRPIAAACCALALAMYDASAHGFKRPAGPVESYDVPFPAARVSGVLGSSDPGRTRRQLRLMRLAGLRDFKLKLGLGEAADAENLRIVAKRLARAIRKGKATLRADVNGGWSADETPGRVAELAASGVCAVEQPIFAPAGEFAELAARCQLPLIADESLVTADDCETLLGSGGGNVWLNIRLSKNGGIWHALSLAEMAAAAEAPFIAGCMVGESSILSAAQRQFLWRSGPAKFVEGNYGKLLLADDLTRRSLRFGYRGKLKPPGRAGLGVVVDPAKIARYATLTKSLTA